MPPSPSRRFPWWLLRTLRWSRFFLLGLLLCVLTGLAYLNWVGLPDFLKAKLEAELRARGISLQFDRLRLRGYRELIADRVRLSQESTTNSFEFVVSEAELQLDPAALRRWHFQIGALVIRGGKLSWPVTVSNAPPHRLFVDDITTVLRLAKNDHWEMANFAGRFLDVDLRMTGSITNPLALRKLFISRPGARPQTNWPARVSALAAHLESIKLSSPAQLNLYLIGDGRNANSFQGSLRFEASKAATPWGRWENLQLSLDSLPSRVAGEGLETRLSLSCAAMDSQWGQARKGEFTADFLVSLADPRFTKAEWQLKVESARNVLGQGEQLVLSGKTISTNHPAGFRTAVALDARVLELFRVQGKTCHATAEFVHSLTNFNSLQGVWEWKSEQVESDWGSSGQLALSGRIASADLKPEEEKADANWGFWSRLKPFRFEWEGHVDHIKSPHAEVDKLLWGGEWRAPEVILHQLHADLYGRQFDASGRINVHSRELQSRVSLDFDVHRISGMLTRNAQRWLRQFSWDSPPQVRGNARLILPAWTNAQPNWQKEVLPTVELAGDFEGTQGAFRNVPISAARSHFTLTNFFWRLPDLAVTRPEGQARLEYRGDMSTQDYYWALQSQIDPKSLKPLLDPPQRRALDFFEFTVPPLIQGEVWGRWHKPEQIAFVARVAATNFSYRGEACTDFRTTLWFTNLFLKITDTHIRRGDQHIAAPLAGYDPRGGLLFVTNGLSTMDPDVVAKVIGKKVRAALRPYHFKQPPTVVVNGQLPLDGEAQADVFFRVAGKSFNYWKLNAPEISGDLYWRGDTLSVSNVQAKFYNGKLAWEGRFDFTGGEGARFGFRGSTAETELRLLMADLTSISNRLEGVLNGNLIITSANSADWQSWNGYGNARLRDGFLWDIPIFGAFSPMLDKLAPGLGNSRAHAGSATFLIDKGIIQTSDLEVRSPALRLQYDGAVDFDGNVNARMQAEILRDAWGVGRVVSLALWPLTKVFEYKVTGTLHAPKSEPLYIPKILLWPFQPFRTIKQIFSLDEPHARTAQPPASQNR